MLHFKFIFVKIGAKLREERGYILLTKQFDPMFSDCYRRQSIRQKNHNYAWSGTYFVTIDTEKREPLFDIPELSTILEDTWRTLPTRFPAVTLEEFIIMPDHIHFIICIEGNVDVLGPLPDVIGAYKSLVAVAWLRHIKANGLERSGRIWQRNYFDRAIRDDNDLEKTRQYIRNNPIRRQNKLRSTE